MNTRILLCAAIFAASFSGVIAQGTATTSKTARAKHAIDLRRHRPAAEIDVSEASARSIAPVIGSPILMQQPESPAMIVSNGYLYVLVGQRLYKISEKTLATVKVSNLGTPEKEPAAKAPRKAKSSRKSG